MAFAVDGLRVGDLNMERFSKADDLTGAWRRDGFVVIRDLFPKQALTEFRAEVAQLYAARFEHDVKDVEAGLDAIRSRYATARSKWQECAKRLWNLPALARLAGLREVRDLAEKLGLRLPAFSGPPEVRIDMPHDEQYKQPWHQDWRYGQGSLNSITMWTPLHDVSCIHGALEVAAGTHGLGYLEVEELQNPRRFSIADKRFSSENGQAVEVSFGETIIFSQFLAHRSGANTSTIPRLSFQIRFSDMLNKAYLEQGYIAPQTSTIVWTKLPSADDVRAAFDGA
jgi:phytanoyl-CoA hydroxylase